jgi:8-oxo-dGTP diphosphatase
MKSIEVVAAVIVHKDQFLCVQRADETLSYISRKWEFPGGKVESDESLEEAVKREIQEELMTDITGCDFLMTVKHQYPDFFLIMHSFICHVSSKEITLTEHIDFRWVKPAAMPVLDWAAADIPIVQKLMDSPDES